MKHNPIIGEHLYIYTPCNMYYVQAVRDPFTVESVSANGNTITIRAARPVFCGPRYYDTMPDRIEDDPNGKRITFCVKESKVIASWDVKVSYYSTRTTYLNKIVDESGNILIWKSSSLLDIKPGMKMKGTVKDHSEYQGEKQTVVTRCAVI